MKKWPIYLFMLLMLFSCGKNSTEKIQDAILDGSIELSRGNCQNAIDALEAIGRQNKNILYLKTLASAYACRAGYSTVTFFASDLAITATPAPLGGTTKFTTSQNTFQSPLEYDPAFSDLQTAINILLYAGGIAATTEPTSTERAKYFSTSELGDLSSQLMFMELAQLGRLLKVYANASATGVKGGGTSGNVCFSNYPSVPANVGTALAALPGACKVTNNVGFAEINSSVTASVRQRRMCKGVVLLNGFFDVLPTVIASATGSLSTVGSGAQTAVNLAKTALVAAKPDIGIVKTTINQNLCEDTSLVPVADLESFYAIMMESMIQ